MNPELINWQELSVKQTEYEKNNPDPWKRPAGPLYQTVALIEIESLSKLFAEGDSMALLAAIRKCANHDLPLPDWVAKAYISAYDEVLNCRSNSWDEVFGKPYPAKHIGKLRQRRELIFGIYSRVRQLNKDGVGLDDPLFEIVGKEFGIKKSLCKELYYKAKNMLQLPK
jgi:hypothetical protein